jgi:hypothetical protein
MGLTIPLLLKPILIRWETWIKVTLLNITINTFSLTKPSLINFKKIML